MPSASDDATPSLRRRFACFVYEGVLLFGVLMLGGLIFSMLTGQRHALQGRHSLQAFLFVVLALYFVGFWSHGGQTLAMRTWRIRVVRHDGAPLGPGRALARYATAWMWFLPALLAVRLAQLETLGGIGAVLAAGVIGYALTSRLHPQRQFWHDALCGTRLATVRPPRSAITRGHNRGP